MRRGLVVWGLSVVLSLPVMTGAQLMGASSGAGSAGSREEQQKLPTKEQIREAQESLKALGLYDGPIDGVVGPKTEAAIRAYQRSEGLAVSGTVDDATLRELLSQEQLRSGWGRPGGRGKER